MKIYQLSMLSLVFACGTKSEDSNLQILNGKNTSKHVSVVQYSANKSGGTSTCTGTFISPKVMITASHCLKDANSVTYKNFTTSRLLVNKAYKNDSTMMVRHDVAFVKFDSNVGKPQYKIATKSIAVDDKVTLVGYGFNEYDNNGKPSARATMGVQREGFNVFKRMSYAETFGIIAFDGVLKNTTADGQGASGAFADSGGPLLVEGKGIVGIYHGNLVMTEQVDGRTKYFMNNTYAMLSNPDAQIFLQEAKQKGYLE